MIKRLRNLLVTFSLFELFFLGVGAAIFILAVIGMSGCHTVRPELTHRDQAVLDRTEEVWRMAYHSWNTPEECLDNVSVVVVHSGNFERLCHKPEFFSEGCIEERGIGYAPGKVISISPAVRPDLKDDAIVHLALHELAKCTAKKGDRDPSDEAHRKEGIWIETSGDASLERFIVKGIRNGVI